MYLVEIRDYAGDVTNGYTAVTLEDALSDIKSEIMDGISPDCIRLYQEIRLDFTVDVKVKAE